MAMFADSSEGPIYLSSLPNVQDDPHEPPERHVSTRDASVVNGFVRKWDRSGRATYFCVGTVVGPRRAKDAIGETLGLHMDIDFKSVAEDEATIREVLRNARLPPSALVRTGGGLHVYWLFKEAISTQDNRERIEAALRQLADLFAGDLAVCEVSRLMRLPGTHNTKYGHPREVVCEFFDGPRYELDDIEDWLSETAPLLHRVSTVGTALRGSTPRETNPYLEHAKANGFSPPLDVEQALADMTFGNIHSTQISVSASLLNAGRDMAEVVEIVINATDEAVGDYGMRWNWTRERRKIEGMCRTWLQKHPPKPVDRETAASPQKEVIRETAASPSEQQANGGQVVQLATARKAKPKAAGSSHLMLADAFLAVQDEAGEALMFTDAGAFRYIDNMWRLQSDNNMRAWLDAALQTAAFALSLEPTNRLIGEARGVIMRRETLRRRDVRWDQHGKVPTLSGLVDPRTGELTPASPDHYCTWRIEVAYDPAATCPVWLDMVNGVFGDLSDSDRLLHVLLLQEMLGAGLIDAHKPKALSRALILFGGSNTGKSGLLEVMGGLYSDDPNSTPLDMLTGAHALMPFARRVPWVLHEAFDQSKWHMSSTAKTLISGEPVQINIKNGPQVEHQFTAPIFWGTNHPPQFKEATKAITNRIVVVRCRRVFDPDKPVGVAALARSHGFGKPSALVLATELPGVLAWAVAGLRRALERGTFVLPSDALDAEHAIQRDANLVLGFIEDCTTYDVDSRVSVPDFSAALSSWWLEHKGEDRRVPSSEAIGRAVAALNDPRIASDHTLRDKHRRYYCGVRLNDEGMRHWRNAVTSEAFVFQGRKASTSGAGESPNDAIPLSWAGKASVTAMRRWHQVSFVTDVSSDVSSTQAADPPF